ncbi:hypothetical protein JG687_00018064 [Phytophthora cactorum]|uniref:Uncharacterized protein n=1 Tax=Phytophthora cactorum TaxID=29920 RepID=A0A8T1TQS4_9STRA|nr:hypothetical protein JG687_00018064 [Phytophthora cactorum]
MSSLTKTPAQESASADSATSVPAQASTSTSESTLFVGEYHARQYKKRVRDKAAAPPLVCNLVTNNRLCFWRAWRRHHRGRRLLLICDFHC